MNVSDCGMIMLMFFIIMSCIIEGSDIICACGLLFFTFCCSTPSFLSLKNARRMRNDASREIHAWFMRSLEARITACDSRTALSSTFLGPVARSRLAWCRMTPIKNMAKDMGTSTHVRIAGSSVNELLNADEDDAPVVDAAAMDDILVLDSTEDEESKGRRKAGTHPQGREGRGKLGLGTMSRGL